MLQTRLSSVSLSAFWLFLIGESLVSHYVPKCEAVKRKVKPWENIHWPIVLLLGFFHGLFVVVVLVTLCKVCCWFFFLFLNRDLYNFDKSRDLAVKTFLEHRACMHPVTSMLVGKDLRQDQWPTYWFLWNFLIVETRPIMQTVHMHAWWCHKMFCCFDTNLAPDQIWYFLFCTSM